MSGLTSYAHNKIIDHMFRGQPYAPPPTYYFALILDASQGGNEVSGGGYSRAGLDTNLTNFCGTQASGSITPSTGSSGQTSNNVVIGYAMPTSNWGMVANVWVYDSLTGGNCIAKGTLDTPKVINAGDLAPLFSPMAFSFVLENSVYIPPSVNDPFYAYVSLLLNMNSYNNSTLFTDAKGHIVTPHGNARITTDVSKFGNGSAMLDGSGDYLEVADAEDLRICSSDFTMEGWLFKSGPWTKILTLCEKYTTLSAGFSFQINEVGKLQFGLFTSGSSYQTSNIAVPINAFSHLAITKQENIIRLFIGGTKVSENTVTAPGVDDISALIIGMDNADESRAISGFLGGFRITKGFARYTTDFAVPSGIFPEA